MPEGIGYGGKTKKKPMKKGKKKKTTTKKIYDNLTQFDRERKKRGL